MFDVLDGVRVVEVASHVFVPLAGAVLADWGAEVVKVEHPVTGDPYRGLVSAGLHKLVDGVDISFQYANRGKQSIGLDLKRAEARTVLMELVAGSDVFLTSLLPDAREHLGIDVADIRAVNPNIVYARGSGYGFGGPDAATAGYDATSYWSRSGIASAFTKPGAEEPLAQRPAFGDVMGAMTVAGGVAAALFKRASTGVTSVVDISLLGVGMWQLQPDIMSSQFDDPAAVPHSMPRGVWNPLAAPYRTQDGRFIYLCALDSERYWAEFCEIIAAPELASDDRFVDMAARSRNGRECVAMLDALFASRPYAEWCQRFSRFSGPWSPVQQARELHADAQALETGCFTDLDTGAGRSLRVVSSPVNFDHVAGTRRSPGAPEVGQHTEEILLGLGRSWEDITVLKETGAVN